MSLLNGQTLRMLLLVVSVSANATFAASEANAISKTGRVVNAAKFTSLSEAVAAAGNKILVIDSDLNLDKDTIVPQNTQVIFQQGGRIIKKATSGTLKFNSPFSAPMCHVFVNFKPADITFGLGVTDEVNPLWWGATPNAEADSSSAIQSALDSGLNIYIPKGRYLVNNTLNCTNRKAIIIRGDGTGEGFGTALIGNTGSIVIDLTGSRQADLRDFDIVAGGRAGTISAKENPSTIGLLYARSEKVICVEFNNLTNIGVFLPSIPSANNGNGTVGIYNYAAELWRARNIYIEGDTAVVFTGYNIYKITSPFTEMHTKIQSMSVCTIDGASTLRGRKGPCVLLENATRIEVLNVYLAGDGTVKDAFPYAIKATSPGGTVYALTVTGHNERAGGWLYTDVNLRGLTLEGTGFGQGPGSKAIHIASGTLSNGEIALDELSDPDMSLIDVPAEGAIMNTNIRLFGKQKIVAPKANFAGNIVRTPLAMADAKKAINVKDDASYILMASDDMVTITGKKRP